MNLQGSSMTLEWANLEKALDYVKEEIIDNMGNRHFTLTIFLDFRKAFDPIEHYILFFLMETLHWGYRLETYKELFLSAKSLEK